MTQSLQHTNVTPSVEKLSYHSEEQYADFIHAISQQLSDKQSGHLLYRSNCEELLEIYKEHTDQSLNCNCCKRFINNIGSALIINDDGSVESAFWNPEKVPEPFKAMVTEMKKVVESCTPVQPLTVNVYSGVKSAGGFKHLYADPLSKMNLLMKPEDFTNKYNYLGSFFKFLSSMSVTSANRASALLTTGKMHREKETLAWLTFLMDAQKILLLKNRKESKIKMLKHIENVAHGWLKPKGGVVGYLLENITEGKSDSEVIAAHNKITKPEAYARPTEAPSDGTVKVAMKLFEEQGLYDSLPHRMLSVAEINNVAYKTFTHPENKTVVNENPFAPMLSDHDQNESIVLDVSPIDISVSKFMQTVVADAGKIEIHGKFPNRLGGFAVNKNNVPEEKRLTRDEIISFQWTNELACILTYSAQQNISPSDVSKDGNWVNVIGIAKESPLFIFAGKPKGTYPTPIFPESVKQNLWPVRSVIEHYCKTNPMELSPDENVLFHCLMLGRVRVTKNNVVTQYTIHLDR